MKIGQYRVEGQRMHVSTNGEKKIVPRKDRYKGMISWAQVKGLTIEKDAFYPQVVKEK